MENCQARDIGARAGKREGIMTDYKGVKIIAVDHGYGNIKTANTVTPTGITEYDSEPVFRDNILEYDGRWYKIGEGHKAFLSDKSLDRDYYLFTLMAVARELKREKITDADVHIACGLPLKWVRAQRENFRSYIMSKKKVTFRYNGTDYHVKFVGCTILPQGYPAIVRDVKNYRGTHMVADIGNGTMNIMNIIDKKVQEERCWTEKLGANECMIKACNAVMDRTGSSIDESTVERVLRFGTADIPEEYLAIIRKVAEDYVEGIFAALRKYNYNPDLMKLHVVGGGAALVRNFGKYDPEKVEIIDDICANAIGYEYIAEQMLRRQKQ